MGVIVPAILPISEADIYEKLGQLTGVTDRVQLDVVDGRFSEPSTWPYTDTWEVFEKDVRAGKTLPHLGEFQFEIDLMVAHPEAVIDTWIAAGANRITIHAESTSRLSQTLTEVKKSHGHDKDFAPDLLSLGLALNVESELALIEPYLPLIDYVQFMGIAHIGRQGEPFDPRVLRKIATFRKAHPKLSLQVDGGVSLKTAPDLLNAGVNRLIVGSDLWKASNVAEEFIKLEGLAEQHGWYT